MNKPAAPFIIYYALPLVLLLSFFCATASQAEQGAKIELRLINLESNPLNPGLDEMIQRLKSNITLSQFDYDEFPVQTDFLFERAQHEISDALRAQGYYHAEIEPQLDRRANRTRITFLIKPGRPTLIRKVDIQFLGDGNDLIAWTQYRQFDLKLKSGSTLNHGDYQKTLAELNNIAINHGYLDAEFVRREFKVFLNNRRADIYIHLDTGQPYRFGEVHFEGSKQIDPKLLARYVEFMPGDVFSQRQLTELQKSFIATGYFGMVKIEPVFTLTEDQKIPIKVQLDDNLPHRYNLGLGYGTDTGARLILGFENRLVNKQGHRYQVDTLIGERAQNFYLNYLVPGKRPAREHWNIRVGWDATQSESLEKQKAVFSPEYVYQPTPEWQINPFLSMENEQYRYTKQLTEQTQILLIGLSLQKRWVNNDAYPTLGYRHNATLQATAENTFSDSAFIQFEIGSRAVFALFEFWRVHGRAQLAVTLTDPDQIIPASYRYLLGGENLRGYKFESIGVIKDGLLQGGQNMLMGSLETDLRFTKYVGIAAFTDAGQTFNQSIPEQLKVGAGAGLRGYTPIGTVKVDFAWPISEVEQNWQFHFSIGIDL